MSDCKDDNNITTYQYFHKGFPGKAPKKAQKIKQTDPELLSGYFTGNIRYKGLPVQTKTWPSRFDAEDYQHFLNRLEKCNKELHDLYYRCPDVDFSLLDKSVKEHEKSVYQVSYSPDELKLMKRCIFPKSGGPANMIYYPTTYGTYFSRMGEVVKYHDTLPGRIWKKEQEDLRNDLKRIYRVGRTTYNDTICLPATLYQSRLRRNAPIDRYTLRRV